MLGDATASPVPTELRIEQYCHRVNKKKTFQKSWVIKPFNYLKYIKNMKLILNTLCLNTVSSAITVT